MFAFQNSLFLVGFTGFIYLQIRMKRQFNQEDLEGEKKPKINYRSMRDVYLHKSTFDCAVSGCIPCLYKIYPYGSYFHGNNKLLKKLPNNQRPESCPRSNCKLYNGLYDYKMNILTVGDGDFSFSLSVAKHLSSFVNRERNEKLSFLATSHESLESLESTYSNVKDNINQLKGLKVKVIHNVDATALNNVNRIVKKCLQFDVIIWNFPCIRIAAGADGQTNELEENKSLIRNFLLNAKDYLKDDVGEVHITHKTIEPFSWWGMYGIL